MNTNRDSFGKRLLSASLLIVTLLLRQLSFGQQRKGPIPDGTTGEMLRMKDSTTTKMELDYYTKFNAGFTTLRVGFGFLYEFAGYAQD